MNFVAKLGGWDVDLKHIEVIIVRVPPRACRCLGGLLAFASAFEMPCSFLVCVRRRK